MSRLWQGNIFIKVLILIILVAGIAGGLYLVRHPQIFKPKATNPAIVFKNINGETLPINSEGLPVTISPTVRMELTSPLGPPPQTSLNIISEVKAQESSPSSELLPQSPEASSSSSSAQEPTSQATTLSYKIAESPTELSLAIEHLYTKHPEVLDYTFDNATAGSKFVWVEFKDSSGRTDRQTAQIILESSSSSNQDIKITTIDDQASYYGTFQSYNQKVVANQNGIFITYVHQTTNKDTAGEVDIWRLARSTDGGATFSTLYEASSGTRAPVIETDSKGNIYLVEANWLNQDEAHFYKFSASNNYSSPIIKTNLSLGTISAKYAMEIDEARSQLYYFSLGNKFTVLNLDGSIKRQFSLTRDGTAAGMHYPSLYLDETGNLFAAWTTVDLTGSIYRSIQFMLSKDGGQSWEKPNGDKLNLPVVADETGPTERITLDDEFTINTWLSNFLVKSGKAHFIYVAGESQHYVRYDLATSRIDKNIYPVFKGDTLSVGSLDGFCASGRSSQQIYCVNRVRGQNAVAILKSDDNGSTWRDFVTATPSASEIYSLGGSSQITSDGFIIGTYTESSNFADESTPKIVKFFKALSSSAPNPPALPGTPPAPPPAPAPVVPPPISPPPSILPSPTSTPISSSIYDLNSDGVINSLDTARFLVDWRGGRDKRDFNNDGTMNSFDYGLLKKAFSSPLR